MHRKTINLFVTRSVATGTDPEAAATPEEIMDDAFHEIGPIGTFDVSLYRDASCLHYCRITNALSFGITFQAKNV